MSSSVASSGSRSSSARTSSLADSFAWALAASAVSVVMGSSSAGEPDQPASPIIGSRGQLLHFLQDRLAHLGGAGLAHVGLHDVGGAEAAGERAGDRLVDQVGFLGEPVGIA